MDKDTIQKNILDLSYKRNLQLTNAILILGGGSALASFTGLILNPNNAFEYASVFVVMSVVSYILYDWINNKLKEISLQISKLAD